MRETTVLLNKINILKCLSFDSNSKVSKKMKFCANLSFMFNEKENFLDRYAAAKEAGFKAVESAFPAGYKLDEVVKAKESAGMDQILINLSVGSELGVTAIPGKEEEFHSSLKETVSYAKALKAKKIHIMSGKVENVSPQHWLTYEKNLKYAVEVLSKENLIGVIEPINPHSVPNYLMNDYEKAIEIIKRVNSPHLRLQLDIFHLQHLKGDLTNHIKKLMPYVGHIQIAQVPNRNEPDTTGEVDYKYILQLISENYSDWVGLEYKPLNGSAEGLGWIKKYGYTL